MFKPGRFILRFIFYKIVIKLYRLYFYLIKRLGLAESLSLLLNQRLIHVIVVILVVLFTIINLTSKTQAVFSEDMAGHTFLSEIISSEFGQNDQLIEEYFDEEASISPAQQTYLDNLSSVRSQPMAEMKSADEMQQTEEVSNLVQGGQAIVKPDLAQTKKTKQPRQEIIYYTVQPGDTISTIAFNFDISVNTVLWENDLNVYSLIRPGDKLTILPMTGISYKVIRGDNLSKIAKTYGVEENVILEANKLTDASQIAVGKKLIIPGGRKTYYASQTAKSYTGLNALSDLLKPRSALPAQGNKMNWPTVGYRITQYFSWRHHAVDIANKIGTPIYAADAGVVEYAGWGTGYGNQIVIDHGGGKKTRYGHLSKIYCKVGEQIDKGETIAAMGSTGYSTGPHLHFEVIINNLKYNPLNYVK